MSKIKDVVKQVLFNPQVSYPPVSYVIKDVTIEGGYISQYMDKKDFLNYLERLEMQLVERLEALDKKAKIRKTPTIVTIGGKTK